MTSTTSTNSPIPPQNAAAATAAASNNSINSSPSNASGASPAVTAANSAQTSTPSGSTAASQQSTSSRPLSYAQATGKKFSGSATIVSSNPVTSPPTQSPVVTSAPTTGPPTSSGGNNQQQQRPFTNSSPVNGKTSIPPAVPTAVATPAIVNSGSVVVNGSSTPTGSHSRKSSMASSPAAPGSNGPWTPQQQQQQQNGLRMPPGQQQPNIPNTIQFGSINQSSNTGGVNSPAPPLAHLVQTTAVLPPNAQSPQIASSGPLLATPAGQNPRATSPQTSPSPVPQPAASGGPPPHLPPSRMPMFGSVNDPPEQNRMMQQQQQQQQRPISLPPNIPMAPSNSQQGHMRRDSSHGPDGQPGGMIPGRGMPQGGNRRGGHNIGGYGNQYPQHHPGHNHYNSGPYIPQQGFRNNHGQGRGGNTGGNGGPVNPGASGIGGPGYQGGGGHMGGYPNNRGGRSPALTHSLPSTPQMGQAQIAANSPQFPYAQHLQPQQMGQMGQMNQVPMYQQGYDPNYYGQQQPYMPYPQQQGYMHPSSPRPHYQMPQQPHQPGFMPQYPQQPQPMSRSSSQAQDQHIPRPPSSMSHMQNTPTLTSATMAPPPLQHPGPSPSSPGNANPNVFKKAEKSKVEIRDPSTRAIQQFNKVNPTSPSPSRSPVIVSSSPAPESHHERSSSRSHVKRPGSGNVSTKTDQEKKDEIKAAVQKKVLEDKKLEEEAKRKKDDDERLAKETEEARLKKEEDERVAKEDAECKAKEEEEERQKKAEEERIAKEEEEAAERERKAAEELESAKKKKEEEEEEERQRVQREEEAKKKKLAEEEAERCKKEEVAKAAADDKAKAESAVVDAAKSAAEAAAASKPLSASSKAVDKLVPDIAKISIHAPPPSDTPPQIKVPEKRERPAPLNLSVKTTSEPALPSAALTALRSARFIDNIHSINYPGSVLSPNPALNTNAPNGKFKYEKDFLLQFQTVFTEKPNVDWDNRMRDTMGEAESARPISARVSSGTGGPKGPRPSSMASAPMGSFGAGKMGMPGGLMNQARSGSNPMAFGAIGPGGMPFNRPPAIARTNSSTGLPGQMGQPASPNTGRNRSTRSQSKRNQPGGPGGVGGGGGGGSSLMDGRTDSRNNKDDNKHMQPIIPASDVKPLVQSEKRWMPRSVAMAQAGASTTAAPSAAVTAAAAASAPPGAAGPGAAGPGGAAASSDDRLPPEMVQRKVKAALNKMTPEKFDKIADQILLIASQSKHESDGRSLRQVIQLTFEKATDEPTFSSMYAKFCKRMLENMDPEIKDESIRDKHGSVVSGGALFRKYLLNRCQEEFERGWKVNLPPKPEGETDETILMSDEYYVAMAAKRRGLGLIQFIGELFKLSMLTERIMHECVKKLVDYEGTPEEEEVESLCKLLRTIGRALDGNTKSRPMMDIYFNRIQQMMDSKDMPSRMRYMLLDVIELRKNAWVSKEDNKGPKTITEIREDAAKQQQEKEAASARANQRQRPQMGRGDGRSFSQGFGGPHQAYHDNRQNQTLNTDDLRRLGAKSTRQPMGIGNFGPSSMFASARSSSGGGGSKKGLGPGSAFYRDDSATSSRTATPPASSQRETVAHANSFSLLSGSLDQADASDANSAASPPTAPAQPISDSKKAEGTQKPSASKE